MKLSKLTVSLAALTLLFALVAGGCGGDSSSGGDSPEAVTESFYSALADGDAGGICDLLSESAASSAAGDADSCEEGVQKGLDTGPAQAALGVADDIEVGGAEIDGDSAKVTVTSGNRDDQVPLVKEDGEWKVDIG